MEKNYYTILQVDQNASRAVIQGAYRALMKDAQYHPDLGGSPAAAQAIIEAYSVLSNPDTRREYDGLLSFSPVIDVEYPETRYILICPSCRNRNLLRDERKIKQAKCGACGHLLLPGSSRRKQHQDDERAFRLGIYLFDKRLYQRALKEFEDAARIKPRHATYRYWLGRCHFQRGTYKDSRAAFGMAARLQPEQFHFQFWLGQSQYALKAYSRAAAGFAAAAKLRPDHTPTLLKLSSCYFHTRAYRRATESLEAAISQEPDRAQPNLWLGISYLAANNPKAARAAFRRAEQLDPGDPTVKKYLKLSQTH
ncbi:MAG: tetratricopeptide repeat protein [SAR324 cluster bacterium]|nr:tetratricopeptide repeat protein [SAR324 cluster bacterium]